MPARMQCTCSGAKIPANNAPTLGEAILFVTAAARAEVAAGESDDEAPQDAVAHVVGGAFDAGYLSERKGLSSARRVR